MVDKPEISNISDKPDLSPIKGRAFPIIFSTLTLYNYSEKALNINVNEIQANTNYQPHFKIDNNDYFNIFTSSLIVKGFKRAIFIDFPNHNYTFTPLLIISIIKQFKSNKIGKVKLLYHSMFDDEIDELVIHLISKGFGFCSSNQERFTKINKEWVAPYLISYIIFEISKDSKKINFKNKLIGLQLVNCICFRIVDYFTEDLDCIKAIINQIEFNFLEIIIDANYKMESINNILNLTSKLSTIYIYGNAFEKTEYRNNIVIIYKKNEYNISINDFNPSINQYTESVFFNTYFNQKIFITKKGDIKNNLESKTSFGNLIEASSKSILTILKSPKFQYYWSAKKDHIDVCKHCEFRYMCVDSRLPIKRKDKEWYFETECNYNPYIAKWQHEDGYKTLEQCGITSNQTGFKLNRKKLNAVNKELWGEDE